MTYQQVTMVDDLPELYDERQGPQPLTQSTKQSNITIPRYEKFIPPDQLKNAQRAIRGGYRGPPPESGMSMQQSHSGYNQRGHQENFTPAIIERDNSPTCIDCAEHIASCPICSKFYNNDKTLYIITIAILAVICILLLKRVLDV